MSDVEFDGYLDPEKVYDDESPKYLYRDENRIVVVEDEEFDANS